MASSSLWRYVSRETSIRTSAARFHVKHLSSDQRTQLQSGAAELGLQLDPGKLAVMMRHLDWVLETTRSLNLTTITDPTEAVRLHIIDSLVAAPEVLAAPAGPMLDMGTGGGFPGIPLALLSDRNTHLVDSVRKKVEALRRFLVQENLDSWISVSATRVEELQIPRTGLFGVVTARALSALPSLVELASPLLADGGRFVALKARPDAEEMRRAEAVASVVGMQVLSVRSTAVPGGDEARVIVTMEKVGRARVALPRRVGMAQRNPLA